METDAANSIAETMPVLSMLQAKARGFGVGIESCMKVVDTSKEIEGLNTHVRVHSVKLDGNGRPMVNQLLDMICDAVLDYAIPRTHLQRAQDCLATTGSNHVYARLTREARKLFVELSNTGEGGELLLFLFAERILQLPQVFSKMYLKTATQMHFHGSDGIHASATSDGKLALYWGESKMHATRTDAVRTAIESLSPYLKERTEEGIRDLQLISQNVDLNCKDLEDAIVAFLSPDSPYFGEAEYRGLVLIGFDSNNYPAEANEKESDILLGEFAKQIDGWKSHLAKHVKLQEIQSFELNVFFVPFPSVEDFRASFLNRIGEWGMSH